MKNLTPSLQADDSPPSSKEEEEEDEEQQPVSFGRERREVQFGVTDMRVPVCMYTAQHCHTTK